MGTVFFADPYIQYKSVYEKSYEIKSTPCVMHKTPYQWNIVKKQMNRIMGEVGPDLSMLTIFFQSKWKRNWILLFMIS